MDHSHFCSDWKRSWHGLYIIHSFSAIENWAAYALDLEFTAGMAYSRIWVGLSLHLLLEIPRNHRIKGYEKLLN